MLEHFIFLLHDHTNDLQKVNEARKHFSFKRKSTAILPTENAVVQLTSTGIWISLKMIRVADKSTRPPIY